MVAGIILYILRMQPHLRRIKLKCTVDAGGHTRENDSGVAFKAFSPTINQRNDGAWVQYTIIIHQQRQLHRKTEGKMFLLVQRLFLMQYISNWAKTVRQSTEIKRTVTKSTVKKNNLPAYHSSTSWQLQSLVHTQLYGTLHENRKDEWILI